MISEISFYNLNVCHIHLEGSGSIFAYFEEAFSVEFDIPFIIIECLRIYQTAFFVQPYFCSIRKQELSDVVIGSDERNFLDWCVEDIRGRKAGNEKGGSSHEENSSMIWAGTSLLPKIYSIICCFCSSAMMMGLIDAR